MMISATTLISSSAADNADYDFICVNDERLHIVPLSSPFLANKVPIGHSVGQTPQFSK